MPINSSSSKAAGASPARQSEESAFAASLAWFGNGGDGTARVDTESVWRRVEARIAAASQEQPARSRRRLLSHREGLGAGQWWPAWAAAVVLLSATGYSVWRPVQPVPASPGDLEEVSLNLSLWQPDAALDRRAGRATEELISMLKRESE